MTVDHRQWAREAIRIIEADFQRSADTHLIPLETPGLPGVELYFKDESSHPTGSLKHRLARSLFLYALCNGWLRPAAPVIEHRAVPRRFPKPISHACWACPSSP